MKEEAQGVRGRRRFFWGPLSLALCLTAVVFFSATATTEAKRDKDDKPRAKTRVVLLSKRTRVRVPTSFRLRGPRHRRFTGPGFQLSIYARDFAQGEAAYLELTPTANFPAEHTAELYFGKRRIPLTRASWGYRAVFGIHPWEKSSRELKASDHGRPVKFIRVKAGLPGKMESAQFELGFANTPFRVFRSSMDLGKYSRTDQKQDPKITAMIRANALKKSRVFKNYGLDHFSANLAHPRDAHYITSPYWAKRVSKRYRVKNGRRVYGKSRVSRHRGVDLWGRNGYPIFAMADGKVVIAEKMYYEGGFVVIDHGNNIFSAYMHQSKVLAQEGTMVKAGDPIGEVGATGAVTGPHLHLALYIRGVPINGLSLLSLPIREL